ncbi:replication initiator [Streptomyces sp. NPDC029004]|uniref:replication initiator n=1 Tax=Streptomyces sp. NPDC029004 TaxID=3154490 RepID=UPI0034039C49
MWDRCSRRTPAPHRAGVPVVVGPTKPDPRPGRTPAAGTQPAERAAHRADRGPAAAPGPGHWGGTLGGGAGARPRRGCKHGCPLSCGAVHDTTDSLVGQPLCADCDDYPAPALWHAHGASSGTASSSASGVTLPRRSD